MMSSGAAAGLKKKKAQTKVAKVPIGEAAGADQKGAPLAEGGGVSTVGDKEPAPTRPHTKKKASCPCADALGNMLWTTAQHSGR
jgi:hypothetical protein